MFRRLFEHYRLAMREARFIRVSLLLSAALNLLTWALVAWFVVPRLSTGPIYAMHYTVYYGIDRIGPVWRLGSTPALGTLLLAINVVLAVRTYVKDRLASAFVMGLTLLFEALLLITAFLNVLLNL